MKTPKQVLNKLSDEALRGAEFALRWVMTSPRMRGVALDLLKDLQEDAAELMEERSKKHAKKS